MKNDPLQLNKNLWVFPPNEICEGGASWWLSCIPEPVLIDCPTVNKQTIDFLRKFSVNLSPRIILTNREAHGNVRKLNSELGWPVLVQEQEAYLLPGLKKLETFSEQHETISGLKLFWTPGPTPGSCVVYAPEPWNVLFCGRLIIPVSFDRMGCLRTRRTFHWGLQKKSFEKLRDHLPANPLLSLASGASLLALEGRSVLPFSALEECE